MEYTLYISTPSGHIERILTEKEIISIPGFGADWIMNAYKRIFNLDISNYRLSDYQNGSGFFNLKIKPEDLEKLRDNKLNELGL